MSETTKVDLDELRRLATGVGRGRGRWAGFEDAASPAAILALIARLEKAEAENARLREALDAIKSLGRVDMRGCWEHEIRDVIGSMTDCADRALSVQGD